MKEVKATGIVRNIDQLGRIVIPKEIRDRMGYGDGTSLEILLDGESIVLKRYDFRNPILSGLTDLRNQIMSNPCKQQKELLKKVTEAINIMGEN